VFPRASMDAVEKRKISCLCYELNANSSVVLSVTQFLYWRKRPDSFIHILVYTSTY
jgi:hypothetical protein